MNIFNLIWEKHLQNVTPAFLRKSWLSAFLLAFADEMEWLYAIFTDMRDKWLYQVRHTAQVGHIEKVLNDAFDDNLRRIYINNVTFSEYIYLWPEADENPHYLQEEGAVPDNPLYLLEGDAGIISPDATVFVPIALKPADPLVEEAFINQIKALVDFYKFYHINYQILYYE